MNPYFRRCAVHACVFALLGIVNTPGWAGATVVDSSARPIKVGLTTAETKAAAKEGKAGRSPNAASRGGYLMRCWNYGRLVYEAPVSGFAPMGNTGNAFMVPGDQQKQILDMRSGLCVIE
jgi:hypothetical protein